MNLKKSLLVSALATILMSTPFLASAAGSDCHQNRHFSMQKAGFTHPGGMMNRDMFKELDLSRSQRKEIRSIVEKHREGFTDQREEMGDHKAEFMLALLDGADKTTLNSMMSEKVQLIQNRMQQGIPMMQEIMTVLTDEQKDKLRQRLQ